MPAVAQSAALEQFERLMVSRKSKIPLSDIERLRSVFLIACDMYGEQMHWTGESLIEHCLGVLQIFADYDPDDDGVVACLVHHALDTKLWTLDDLEERYGPTVRSIVSGVHLLSHVTLKDRRMPLESLRLMFLRVSDDIRVVLLILCDRFRVLHRLHAISQERKRILCRDVLNLFAPVAARLGMYSMKHQLESLAFPVAYPTDSARIAEQLATVSQRHGGFLSTAAESLQTFLREGGIQARVEGRQKHPYSIFQKMKQKSLTHVEDVYDLFALRVIVDTDVECYQALGLLHRIGHPVPNRFKDYIAFPKPNGYKSLHTTLAQLPGVPEGMFAEVQIRTAAMHREADLGMAAHWSYKEGGGSEHAARRAQLQQALSMQQPLQESKQHAFSDHIFVLTPKGDVIELPEGSTPLDFAFQVHTTLGLSFKAARVNGSIVQLQYQLENGDVIEILKHRDPHPSPNWVNLLRTASARSRLKRYLASSDRPALVQAGRDTLNKELSKRHLPPLDPDLNLLRSLDGTHLSSHEREDLLMSIGQGAQSPSGILIQLDALRTKKKSIASKVVNSMKHEQVGESGLVIEGGIPMPLRFARCCKADELKKKELQGVIGRDGVVRVHASACKLLRNGNPERRIGVRWAAGSQAANS